MTDAVSNRFSVMFEKTGVTEKKKKGTIDFGEAMAGDEGINATFRALHETTPSPAVEVQTVTVPEPVVKPVIVRTKPVIPITVAVAEPVIDKLVVEPVSIRDHDEVTPLDGHTVSPLNHNTITPSNGHTVTPSDSESVRRSDAKTPTPFQPQTVSRPHPQTVSHPKTLPQTPMQYVPLDVLNLAYNQASVLEYLISNTSGITNARAISDYTYITIPSVREALLRLVAKGFMHKPVTVRDAAFQGFSYVLNKALCDHFISAGGLGQENYRNHQTLTETVRPSDSMTVRPSNSVTIHSSREFLQELKPTTTSDHETVTGSDQDTIIPSNVGAMRPSDGFILSGAIGAYWEGEGLGEGQAQKWCQQFEVDSNQMRQQLDWARFDLEINNRRETVTKDTVSWFFGHLRKTAGCFPKPVNYRSPLEIRAEALQQQQERDKEAKALIEANEAEIKFQAFMNDPDTPLFDDLYAQISSFAKEQYKEGQPMVAEIELRELFKNLPK